VLCIGVLEWVVALGVFVKNQFSRWTGVVVLAANAIAQLLMIPAYPFWSLSILALDILAIYGLIAYGSGSRAADRPGCLSGHAVVLGSRPANEPARTRSAGPPAGGGYREPGFSR